MTSRSPKRMELLRESLPYIRRFKGKTFVIKLSGKVTDSRDNLVSLAEEIALFHQVGFRVVVVHGGGKQLSELAEKLGVPQTIVDGRRVTDAPTLEIAKMVFAGKIRTDVLSALRGLGVRTVGLSGLDGDIIRARRRQLQKRLDRTTGREELVDYGHVGDIVEIDGELLRLLLDQHYLPVVSSLGADDKGNVYNINADTIASEIAVHLGAEKLILLSDVDGLLARVEDPSSKISYLSVSEVEGLLEEGRVASGMIPKLTSIAASLRRGVASAHIINGGRRNALLQEVFTDQGTGTMIGRGEAAESGDGNSK
ncbi:MAG TPA: acetylglutamate kinase [Acidobacteriota bacterium]|nr:acetylglutamate kinase [Acidobacteriota bacterium]